MPQTLGKYLILNLLGSGATADVYQARDTVLGREVALKVLKPALVPDPQAFARFIQEAQAAAQLFHPHIATVLDIAETDGRYYIAMRYIPGRSLDRILKEDGPLPWAEVLRLAGHIGAALDYAHQQGFLHRDVKPSNIVRADKGEYVLTDFGLTRAMMSTGLTSHTGAVLGTPAYIPPEIWQGETATPATDQYALACVVYEALTGQALFSGETPPAIMTAHVLKGARLPAAWPAGVPASATPALERALRPEPAARWGSVGEFVGALSETLKVSETIGVSALPIAPGYAVDRGEGVGVSAEAAGVAPLTTGEEGSVAMPTPPLAPLPAQREGEGEDVSLPPFQWRWVGLLVVLAGLVGLAVVLKQQYASKQITEDTSWIATQTAQAAARGRIAFLSNRDGSNEIYVMNVDGSGLTRLTNNDAEEGYPAWSPDGRRIAFESGQDGNTEIYVMNADGSGQTRLTDNALTDWSPAWLPDGNRIAFASDRDGNWEIYVMNADGSGQTRLTDNGAIDMIPTWSPDGQHIAFQSDRDGNWEIYVMNADGSGQSRLTNAVADDTAPAWSPDGRQIAFTSSRDGNPEIYVMNADGSGQTRLTDAAYIDSKPTWSPDGRQVAFVSYRDGNAEIYMMNVDGSEQINLTNNETWDDWPSWSP